MIASCATRPQNTIPALLTFPSSSVFRLVVFHFRHLSGPLARLLYNSFWQKASGKNLHPFGMAIMQLKGRYVAERPGINHNYSDVGSGQI